METITANRACALLYAFVKNQTKGIYLLPANVCPVVPLTLKLANVVFEFVDIDKSTLCANQQEILKKVELNPEKYIGLIFVRTYGVLFDTKSFFCRLHGVNSDFCIIDDRCLCLPELTLIDDYGADMVLYSTGHCKQVDMNGGGYAFVHNKKQIDKSFAIHYSKTDIEGIYKRAFKELKILEDCPTGWLDVEINKIDKRTYFSQIQQTLNKRAEHRKKLNKIYSNNLPKEIQLPKRFHNWRFNIIVPTEKKGIILGTIFSEGLFASSHYCCANKLFDNEIYFLADNLSKGIINLFNDFYYTEEMAFRTCQIINMFLGSKCYR